MIKEMAPFTKKYGLYAILAPITVIGEVLLEIRIPVLMADIVDVGIPAGDIGYVLKTGALMLLMALLALLCGVLCAQFAAKAGMGFGSEVRAGIFHKIEQFSFKNIDKFSTASLITRMTTDVTNAQNAFMMVIRMLVRAPVMLVSATIMAYRINNRLVAVFLVVVPILAVCIGALISLSFPRFLLMLKKYDSLNAIIQETLIAIRVVKAYVRAPYEKEKFRTVNDENMRVSISAEKLMILTGPLMQIAMYSCIIAIIWFGGNMIVAGDMLTGQLISFISYVTQILMSLMMISMVFINLVLSRASIGRIVEVLNESPDIADAPSTGARMSVIDGSIEFKDVCFKYAEDADENTLEHINLSIRAGETVGIIGSTGSAKSTLVQLIPRLYDVTHGQVLVGGHDVRAYSLDDLRAAVSMVLQKNVLFSGTIRENLLWGNPQATDAQMIAACRAAQADSFIRSFPQGYDTDLSQGGVNVSGGQKQRLCIARALLRKPRILILDDSTSAVDTATDAKIRQALREWDEGVTTLVIAQRIASVCDADKIIVLDDGHVNAVGTHDELLKTNDIYREVYQSQQKGVA